MAHDAANAGCFMGNFCRLVLPCLCIAWLAAGCAAMPPDSSGQFLPSAVPSQGAQRTYAYLKMEQAMRHDDVAALLAASRELLSTGPASRPLADAVGWLLGNRHETEGAALLKEAVAALPDDLPLRAMLAEMLLDGGDPAAALGVLNDFVKTHPDNIAARTDLALLYLKTDHPREALAIFEQLPPADRAPSVLYYHAQALRACNRPAEAAAMLRAALAEAPDFLEAMLELAMLEESRGRHAEARKLYEKLLTYDESNQDIQLRLLMVLIRAGNHDRAYAFVAGMPDAFAFTLTAVSLFMDEGRFDLASSLLDMLDKKPDIPGEVIAFYQAAVAFEGKRDVKKALAILDTIPPGSRYYERSLKLRIQILFGTGEQERAIAVAREGLALAPADAEFASVLVEMLAARKEYQEARQVAAELLRTQPDNGDLAFRHAFMLDLQGRKAEALSEMEALLERFPDSAHILNYIGYSLAEENRDLDRALELVTKAVDIAPNTDYMLDSLAWVYYRLGRNQEAWDTIRRALASPEKVYDATMWDHYGDIAYAVGLRDEAAKGWKKALEIGPADAAAIRAKLDRL